MARLNLLPLPRNMQEGGLALAERFSNATAMQTGGVTPLPQIVPDPPKLSDRFSDVIKQQEATAGLQARPLGPSGFSLGPDTQVAPQSQQLQSAELFAPPPTLALQLCLHESLVATPR